MIKKHLVRTACALATAVIVGTTIPVLAQEAEETVETQVVAENEERLQQKRRNTENIEVLRSPKLMKTVM